ncbi:KGGVGR-motif variant AAA ATPase [Ensifer aridi]|uniref:KGGVGR-motif variant AAA ATPase n=1 Tax=Ensifer aridi TaxID=1708715 RepID=UPI000A10649B|nr:AAA family ATPase [Ensifer aridi]
MTFEKAEGRIVTFYSFKGGVGRTMALANVAFLAAQNGYRVLVMDWDLEAPGLPYYFRGLVDGAELKNLKEAAGILDLMWQWRNSLSAAKSQRQVEGLFDEYESGEPFTPLVQRIHVNGDEVGGVLDYVGAGSPEILTPEPLPYEEALARFSWPEFFENHAGGALLQSLRDWAKSSYDFVFIDSRTGMADVAGICTMQLPDAVALCFVLNRQNIDGVSRVAAAIRARREDLIELRAMPMRAAGVGASLETDATARAQLQLTKIGGFSSDALQDDFKGLSVNAVQDLPYYETLAPFVAQDPNLDYLTLNYLRAANHLLGTELQVPDFEPEWMATIQRRLQPTHATVEYVLKLKGAEPSRAVDELSRLIESAFEDEIDGAELEDEYVSALVEAALGLTDYSDSPFAAVEMLNRAIDLLRDLTNQYPEKWKTLLVSALERCLSDLNLYLDPSEELALLEELDGLLATNPTLAARLRRIANRRRAARIYVNEHEIEAANQTIGELAKLIKDLKDSSANLKISPDQHEEVIAGDVDVSLLRGDIAQQHENFDRMVKEYSNGLEKLSNWSGSFRAELIRLQYDLNSRLARAPKEYVGANQAADYALQAARAVSWSAGANALVGQFVDLAMAVLRAEDDDIAFKFLDAAFMEERRGQIQYANYYGRHPRVALNFLTVLESLSRRIVGIESPRKQSILRQMGAMATVVYSNLERRKHTINEKTRSDVKERLHRVMEIVSHGENFERPLIPPKRPRSE